MRRNSVRGALAAVVLMAASEGAYAANVVVNCLTDPQGAGALAALFNSGGTANTEYDITGPCNGNFSITQDNISIVGEGATQTINGGITVIGATNVKLYDLTINGEVAVEQSASVVITALSHSSTIQNSAGYGVLVADLAHVGIGNTTVQNNAFNGLYAIRGGVITANGVTVTSNSQIGLAAEFGSTVDFASGSISQAGAPPGSQAVLTQYSSFVRLDSSTVTGTSGCRTVQVLEGSRAVLEGGTITGGTNCPTVIAQDSSHVSLFGTTVTGPTAGNDNTVLVARGSSALIQGSNISADTPFNVNTQFAIITVADTSSATLAGGDTITNNAAGGLAVSLSDGSALKEEASSSGNNDSITGDGRIHTQSVIDLGALPGAAALTWNGNIFLSQASSFTTHGDNVTVNGTLTLGQSANGYFNHSAGTSNNISHVQCTSTTDHVANPTLVNPNVTIGPPPGCALF